LLLHLTALLKGLERVAEEFPAPGVEPGTPRLAHRLLSHSAKRASLIFFYHECDYKKVIKNKSQDACGNFPPGLKMVEGRPSLILHAWGAPILCKSFDIPFKLVSDG